jgi:K+-sensing histidine kinase KdpD
MSILEKMKKYWLVILGAIIVIGLIINYFDYILTALIMLIVFVLIISLVPISIYAIKKSIETGFMGFFILLACAIYNPNFEKFNSFIEQENKQYYNDGAKLYSSSDWILFSIYRTSIIKKMHPKDIKEEFKNRFHIYSDSNDSKYCHVPVDRRTYIGILKTFLEIQTPKHIAENLTYLGTKATVEDFIEGIR